MAECRTHPRRILLVDDNREFVRALELFLSHNPRFSVVGCALSGREGVQLAQDLRPEIALVDYDMPIMNGLEAVREIKRHVPAIHAVVVTGFVEYENQLGLGAAGADGFISKDRIEDDLAKLLDSLPQVLGS